MMRSAKSGRRHDEVLTGLDPRELPPEILRTKFNWFMPRATKSPVRALVATLAAALMVFVATLSVSIAPGSNEDDVSKGIVRTGPSSLGSKPEALGKGDLYALVVGVSKYKEPRLCLNFAAKDAKDFAAFLKTQAIESAGLDAVESVWFHHKGQQPGR